MDISRFADNKTGQLVKVNINGGDDWAFVPNPLPPNWQFPIEMWPLLAEAKEKLALLNGIGRTLPNPELLLRPLRSREALRSSSLEGTYASPEELLLFEKHPRTPKSDTDPANAWLEVLNYSQSLTTGMSLLNDEEFPFSLPFIRRLHNILLHGVRGKDKDPGNFRRIQVHVGSDRRYMPPPVTSLPDCLDKFEKRLHQPDPSYDPLVRCYFLHYQFEAIHPFRDGNGRVGRVFLALMTYKWCHLSMPWLYMSAFFEKYKDEYIDKLFKVSSEGNWADWIKFCLRGTIEQANDAIRRCEELRALKDKFNEIATPLGTRMHLIIEQLFNDPMLTITEIRDNFSVSYPSAQQDIKRLIEVNILEELGSSRPKTFFSPDIFRIAYKEE